MKRCAWRSSPFVAGTERLHRWRGCGWVPLRGVYYVACSQRSTDTVPQARTSEIQVKLRSMCKHRIALDWPSDEPMQTTHSLQPSNLGSVPEREEISAYWVRVAGCWCRPSCGEVVLVPSCPLGFKACPLFPITRKSICVWKPLKMRESKFKRGPSFIVHRALHCSC